MEIQGRGKKSEEKKGREMKKRSRETVKSQEKSASKMTDIQ